MSRGERLAAVADGATAPVTTARPALRVSAATSLRLCGRGGTSTPYIVVNPRLERVSSAFAAGSVAPDLQAVEDDRKDALASLRSLCVDHAGHRAEYLAHVVELEVLAELAGALGPVEQLRGRLEELRRRGLGVEPSRPGAHRLAPADVLSLHRGSPLEHLDDTTPRVRVLQGRLCEVDDARHLVGPERLKQRLLGREVAVDGAHANAGAARDLLHLRIEAVRREGLTCGVEHPTPVSAGIGAKCSLFLCEAGPKTNYPLSILAAKPHARP